jgi:signal transduction histidine kinase
LEQANQRLLALDGLRHNLISGISDEMRPPLQSIIAFMESAENRAGDPPSAANNVDFEKMLRHSRYLLALIERMTKESKEIDSDNDQTTLTGASS